VIQVMIHHFIFLILCLSVSLLDWLVSFLLDSRLATEHYAFPNKARSRHQTICYHSSARDKSLVSSSLVVISPFACATNSCGRKRIRPKGIFFTPEHASLSARQFAEMGQKQSSTRLSVDVGDPLHVQHTAQLKLDPERGIVLQIPELDAFLTQVK